MKEKKRKGYAYEYILIALPFDWQLHWTPAKKYERGCCQKFIFSDSIGQSWIMEEYIISYFRKT